jgi:5-histidylcysteine sulfoxide synthase
MMSTLTNQIVTQNIVLDTGDVEDKRSEILQYFISTWELYESLFKSLSSDEAYYMRPQPLRHPLIFYYGHTAVFFVNKLVLNKQLDERIHPEFESLFAIGVDEMSWDDLNDAHYDWPTLAELQAYRDKVKARIISLIEDVKFSMPIDWHSPLWTVMMGIEHERIHLETSSVLIRQLPLNAVCDNPLFQPIASSESSTPENQLIPVKGGMVELGKEGCEIYGWDNEFGKNIYDVSSFNASRYLVSNREYLTFMEAGGYTQDAWWEAEGLAWRNYHQATKPEFWRGEPDEYRLRLMTVEIALPLNLPVEVSYHEARAFCNWMSEQSGKSIRMPDEAEYRRLMEVSGVAREHHLEPIEANWNL